VAGDHRVGQLRQHCLVVAHDALEQRLAGAKAGQQVAPHFLLDGLALVSARAELADGLGPAGGHPSTIAKALRLLVGVC